MEYFLTHMTLVHMYGVCNSSYRLIAIHLPRKWVKMVKRLSLRFRQNHTLCETSLLEHYPQYSHIVDGVFSWAEQRVRREMQRIIPDQVIVLDTPIVFEPPQPIATQRPCRCGSTTHRRTNHRDCPFNTRCRCGSTTHRRTNHRDCPLNPKRSRMVIQPSTTQSELADIECSVCLDSTDHSNKTKGRCSHTFHTKCIQHWVTEQAKIRKPPSCPLCRSNFV